MSHNMEDGHLGVVNVELTREIGIQSDCDVKSVGLVLGTEYGQLAEGDRGELAFQGTRFLSFER